MRLLLFLLAASGALHARLSYLDCSTGLRDNPRLEGGRTELELADIDNDGNIDILSIGDHGSPWINTQQRGVMVWFGNGTGGWTNYMPWDTLGYGGLAVGDVNWDGHWDVGYGMHHNYARGDLGDQVMEVALGDGTGRRWTPWDDSLAREGQDWGMFSTDFADIDNDGDLDVGSISFGADDGIHVYLNLENGAWRRSFGFIGGNSKMEFYFRDVNRDGNADFIAAHGYGTVWFGDGQGGYTPRSTGLPSSSYGLAGVSVGDVDNDGGCDLAFCTTGGGVEVWRWNDAEQRWTGFSGGLPGTGQFGGTQLCDMNADGFIDVCAIGGGQVRIWTGDGAGNWTEAATITVAASGSYSAFRTGCDFDHNGRPDLALVIRESARNYAYAFKEATPAESLRVFPVFPRGGEKFLGGSVQFIDWWSEAPNAPATRVKLELSTQGQAGPWQLIADSLRNAGRYQWLVPATAVSADCFVRYTVYGPSGSAVAMTSRSFTIGSPTAVGENEQESARPAGRTEVRLLPNPARDRVTVEFCGAAGPALLALYDATGRRVRTWPAVNAAANSIDLDCLSTGVYYLSCRTAQGVSTARLGKTE